MSEHGILCCVTQYFRRFCECYCLRYVTRCTVCLCHLLIETWAFHRPRGAFCKTCTLSSSLHLGALDLFSALSPPNERLVLCSFPKPLSSYIQLLDLCNILPWATSLLKPSTSSRPLVWLRLLPSCCSETLSPSCR
jgi:hypothetical protein